MLNFNDLIVSKGLLFDLKLLPGHSLNGLQIAIELYSEHDFADRQLQFVKGKTPKFSILTEPGFGTEPASLVIVGRHESFVEGVEKRLEFLSAFVYRESVATECVELK